MPFRILVTEPIMAEALDELRKSADVTVGNRGDFNDENALAAAVKGYDALISMLSNPVSRKVLEAGDRLKVVANYAVGYNNVDAKAAKELGIHVTNTPGALTEATADLAWALILSAARKLPQAETALRDGKFDGWEPLGFLGYDLNGKTLGIIGMGRIGQAVARRAVGFGMRILYHNRNQVDPDVENALGATFEADYRELVRKCDILSLNCPLTAETRHMINAEVLHEMKRSAIVVNTGRGPLIDEAALAKALHDGWIAGAGLDVFEEEPKVHPDLLTAPNAVLIPHIGSATFETRQRMAMLSTESVIHLLEGKSPDSLPNLVV